MCIVGTPQKLGSPMVPFLLFVGTRFPSKVSNSKLGDGCWATKKGSIFFRELASPVCPTQLRGLPREQRLGSKLVESQAVRGLLRHTGTTCGIFRGVLSGNKITGLFEVSSLYHISLGADGSEAVGFTAPSPA